MPRALYWLARTPSPIPPKAPAGRCPAQGGSPLPQIWSLPHRKLSSSHACPPAGNCQLGRWIAAGGRAYPPPGRCAPLGRKTSGDRPPCPPPGRCAPPGLARPESAPGAGTCGRFTVLPGTCTFIRPIALAGNCRGIAGAPTGPPGGRAGRPPTPPAGGRHVADRIGGRLTLMLL